jgi:DNA-binding NarL/FixJ family response regulator
MTEQKIKVFVIDDEFYTLDSLRIFISQDPRTVYVGGNQIAQKAITALRSAAPGAKPDVVLVDMRFRDTTGKESIEGLELVQEIDDMRKSKSLNTKILCLSMSLDPSIVISALSCGANGYLDKNQATEGIIDAIELVYDGHMVISPIIADKLVGLVRDARSKGMIVFPEKPGSTLSKRTEEVSYLYYRCGMRAKEIAKELHVSESTVRTHIKRAKSVLEASSRGDLIQKLTRRLD